MNSKNHLHDLAIFGGQAAFRNKLHVGRPNIGNRDRLLARLNDMLDRRWLTNNGPYVRELEHRITELIGVKHCLATCSGTMALELLVRAGGLTGEVIIPSFTFIATAHALQWQGITPIFCDVNLETHNIDPDLVEKLITPRTTGVIGVHLWGRPCDVTALMEVTQKHNLQLFFDAAHAFGCSYKGGMIGNYGLAEIFSFHATKFFNTFEGGAITTNSDALAAKLRLMRNFGFVAYDNVAYLGINGKMNEASAAMGLTLLEELDELIALNYDNYQQYRHHLQGITGLKFVAYDETEKSNYQYVALELDETVIGIRVADVVDILHAENVLARRYFYPGCHRLEPYRSLSRYAQLNLPQTESLAKRMLCLPSGAAIGPTEIDIICQIIRFVVAHGPEVRERLRPPETGGSLS